MSCSFMKLFWSIVSSCMSCSIIYIPLFFCHAHHYTLELYCGFDTKGYSHMEASVLVATRSDIKASDSGTLPQKQW